ncbi:helicase associated domain-containing protein [Streptomyces sp. NPDC092369]|uniref:helicase associated domain-containing protein n=1 Tax=Streptomyces sp. NPDC092369 TaxID=3366015 RepID=UPI00381E6DAE
MKAIDPDWNPEGPTDWQRHYAAVREMLVEESVLAYVEPGVTVHGMDVGRWLERQRRHDVWHALRDGQRERLEQLGLAPLPPQKEALAPGSTGGPGAFERGIEALRQYKNREGHLTVPRGHKERLEDGTEVQLGVFLSNNKSRRGKLTADKLRLLADLGLACAEEAAA